MHLLGRHLDKVPRPDRVLYRFEDGVFANAWRAAHDEGVIDLHAGALHPLRQKVDQVFPAVGMDSTDVVDPADRSIRVAEFEDRRSVKNSAWSNRRGEPNRFDASAYP